MKTVLITSFHVFISRNILGSGFFERLCRDSDLKIIILVPEKKKDFFEKNYGTSPNVVIEGVKGKVGRVDAYLNDFALASFTTTSAKIRRRLGMGWIFDYTKYLFFFAPAFFRIYHILYRLFTPRARYKDIFEKHKPDFLFSTDIFAPMDANIMLDAKAFGVPILGMIRSWDNLTTKGPFCVRPDILVVANNLMKKEAVEIHGYSPNAISVVGIPHYDRYGVGPVSSRQDSLKRLGIPSDKRFFVYSPHGDRFFPRSVVGTFDRDAIELISSFLPDSHVLLVRLPPADSVTLDGIKIRPGKVFYDRPGEQLSVDPKFYKQNELSQDDENNLIDTLHHCDGIISLATTLAIDGAFFDKPQIVIGFWLENRVISKKSAIHAQEYNHMVNLVESKGVRLVKNKDDLAQAIKEYSNDPTLDHEGRMELVEEQCFSNDRNSSARLLDEFDDFLKKID